jgi:hypothetical protein
MGGMGLCKQYSPSGQQIDIDFIGYMEKNIYDYV